MQKHRELGDDAEAEAYANYDEYLRMLDDLPVLSDVVSEPPRVRIRDFRRGERPDVRKTPREDPYTLREQHALDLEERYREYVQTLATGGERALAKTPPRRSVPKKRRASPRKASKRRKA